MIKVGSKKLKLWFLIISVKKMSKSTLIEYWVLFVDRVNDISFVIEMTWYFSMFFTFIKTYCGLGGKLSFCTILESCLISIWGFSEKFKSFDTKTISKDLCFLDNSVSSNGNLHDKTIVWLSLSVNVQKRFQKTPFYEGYLFFQEGLPQNQGSAMS